MSFESPNKDSKSIDILFNFKGNSESYNSELTNELQTQLRNSKLILRLYHSFKKVYQNHDQDAKYQSGTIRNLQNSNQDLKVMNICDININYSEKEFWVQHLRLSWLMYAEKLTLRNKSTVLTMMGVPDGHLIIYPVLNCSMTWLLHILTNLGFGYSMSQKMDSRALLLIIAVKISICLGFDNLEYHTNKCKIYQTN